tara:strand:- start:2356 stop:3720 length:1365 start_codon:yes stop_codon:yes gene_type:complete
VRITEHQLRRIIRGSLSEAAPPTVGAVLDAIEAIQGAENKAAKKEKLKDIAKKVGWEAVKFIPVLAGLPAIGELISNAKKAGDVYKLAKKTPDEKVAKDDVVLDMLDIDDQYQLMLDDALEAEFDEQAVEKLNSLPRDALLPDMTAELEKWVKGNFEDRGIEGAVTENRVRVTKGQLRRLVREERFRALLSEASPEIENVGDLKAAIAAASGKKRDEQGKAALKDFGKGFLADLFPGGGTALSIHDLLKSTYTMDDEARTGTALDYLDVDDNISAIVDNPIETKFLNALAKEVEAMSDDTPLEDLNMTNLLSRYLKGEFNQRTVAGFEEGKKLKITEHQLRLIIREQLEESLPPLTPGQHAALIELRRLAQYPQYFKAELDGTSRGVKLDRVPTSEGTYPGGVVPMKEMTELEQLGLIERTSDQVVDVELGAGYMRRGLQTSRREITWIPGPKL